MADRANNRMTVAAYDPRPYRSCSDVGGEHLAHPDVGLSHEQLLTLSALESGRRR